MCVLRPPEVGMLIEGPVCPITHSGPDCLTFNTCLCYVRSYYAFRPWQCLVCSLKKCVCKVKSRAENGSVQHADHRSSTRNSAGQIRVGVQKFAQFGKRQPRAVQFRKTTGRAPVHKPRTRCTLCKNCKTGDSQRLVISEMGVGFYRKTGPERGSATGRFRDRVPVQPGYGCYTYAHACSLGPWRHYAFRSWRCGVPILGCPFRVRGPPTSRNPR